VLRVNARSAAVLAVRLPRHDKTTAGKTRDSGIALVAGGNGVHAKFRPARQTVYAVLLGVHTVVAAVLAVRLPCRHVPSAAERAECHGALPTGSMAIDLEFPGIDHCHNAIVKPKLFDPGQSIGTAVTIAGIDILNQDCGCISRERMVSKCSAEHSGI
jgi:hypothetical protein